MAAGANVDSAFFEGHVGNALWGGAIFSYIPNVWCDPQHQAYPMVTGLFSKQGSAVVSVILSSRRSLIEPRRSLLFLSSDSG